MYCARMGIDRRSTNATSTVRRALAEADVDVERVNEATDGEFGARLAASALTVSDLAAVGGLTRIHPAVLIGSAA
jgi:hypothetical protein